MDNTEVKITFQNKVTGFSGKTGLMAYEEKLKSYNFDFVKYLLT